MALYRIGDSGAPVRDIQDRLHDLGFSTAPDPAGVFDEGTVAAVTAFQESRRLPADGLVGRETWRTIVDAGYELGDRLLYHRMPMLHGDDVAALQRSLNAIGFDAGPVDGIFGASTLDAVIDYQQNRHMAEDGVVGPEVLAELNLMSRETTKMGRHHVRERVWLAALPPSLVGLRVFLDPFCRDEHEAAESWTAAGGAALTVRDTGAQAFLARSADTRPAERLRAEHANEIAADLILGFCHPGTDVAGIYYFASAQSHSEAGAAIAAGLARRLGVRPAGRTMPLLRVTRAPAVVVSMPHLDSTLGRSVVRALEGWFSDREKHPAHPR